MAAVVLNNLQKAQTRTHISATGGVDYGEKTPLLIPLFGKCIHTFIDARMNICYTTKASYRKEALIPFLIGLGEVPKLAEGAPLLRE